MLVSIVTPTTGNPALKQAMESVQNQTYENIEYLVVVDGDERLMTSMPIVEDVELKKETNLICLPYAVGKDRFNGHRIYGASTFLINGDFIVFLDEDNWFDPEHIESLVDLVRSQNLDWAYALRKITDPEGNFVAYDDCESLGKWPAYTDIPYYLIDVNCYFIRKELAVFTAPLWYRRYLDPDIMPVDQILCENLMRLYPQFDTNGRYTVNYRTGNTPLSITADFFVESNLIMKQRYPTTFPWRKCEVS